MDKVKFEQLIIENMKSIFGFALTRVGDVYEAEELSSDIIFKVLTSLENLKNEDSFYGYMWKIAENTYVDYMRNKAKIKFRTAELDTNLPDESASALDYMLEKSEINLLRRELALLSKQYRDATILFYIDGFSCSEIAEKLCISTEMVKYYLFRARKIIREGMNMERLFGEKSYRPSGFEIDFWGTKAGDSQEYREFCNRKIKGNILLAAYYNPVSIQELSIELGVAVSYLEDEIKLLIDRQYLIKKNGKYLTNIPIFTSECTDTINEKLDKFISATAHKFIEIMDEFELRFGNRFSNENLMRWQKVLLCLRWSLVETENDITSNYGDLPKDGPYSLVNGGGGNGIIWGRSTERFTENDLPCSIQGIYNGCPSSDGRGSVVAMNFRQTLNAQNFEFGMTDPVVCTAVECFEYLPEEWKNILHKLDYETDGKPNFPVWTIREFETIEQILKVSTATVTELNRKTSEIAATVTADFAPAHIRSSAEYVGAFVYRFNSIETLVNKLFEIGYLKPADDKEKPAMCVVKY